MADVPMPDAEWMLWCHNAYEDPYYSNEDGYTAADVLAYGDARAAAVREKARGLVEALEALIANRDKYHPDRERFVETSIGSYWSPSASMIGSDAVAAARSALAAYQQDQP